MKLYLDSCKGSAGMSSLDSNGLTPFLSACRSVTRGQAHSKRVFSFLLDRGADISDLDPTGQSCLHLCLKAKVSLRNIKEEREGLIYLIERGANVWARDRAGRSVSHVVYSTSYVDDRRGSFRRDLWDLVLTASGYNVLEVRGNIRRVGWYPETKGGYSRADFRQLWKGREHLCPYPEDLEDPGWDLAHLFDPRAEKSSNDKSNVDNPDSNSSDMTESGDEGESERRVRCEMCLTGGPECRRCGWSFGCRDPNCGYCSDSDDGLILTGESGSDLQEEDHEVLEALLPDSTTEAWPRAPRAESNPFLRAPDHVSVGMGIQHWARDVQNLDDLETQGRGFQSSIPVIEMDNPWADAERL